MLNESRLSLFIARREIYIPDTEICLREAFSFKYELYP